MNILVLTYWNHNDALVQTYTLPYVEMMSKHLNEGEKIFLVTLNKDENLINPPKNFGNQIIHVPLKYYPFSPKMVFNIFRMISTLKKLIKKNNIQKIHAWCTPAGVIGYMLSKSTKVPLIIDSYEPHAESMVENGEWQPNSNAYKILHWFEQKMSSNAEAVIALSNNMKDYAKEKYNVELQNFYVKPALFVEKQNHFLLNRADLNIDENATVGIYAGKFGGIYLFDETIDLIKASQNYFENHFFIVLTANKSNEVLSKMKEKGIDTSRVIVKNVPQNEVSAYMKIADYAINPVKPVPSKRCCTSIKDTEYWQVGLPIIISKNIGDDSDLINQFDLGYVLQSYSEEEFTKAFDKIDLLIKENQIYQRIQSNILPLRKKEIAENIYKEIYGSNN